MATVSLTRRLLDSGQDIELVSNENFTGRIFSLADKGSCEQASGRGFPCSQLRLVK
jgi:hypothetical protein